MVRNIRHDERTVEAIVEPTNYPTVLVRDCDNVTTHTAHDESGGMTEEQWNSTHKLPMMTKGYELLNKAYRAKTLKALKTVARSVGSKVTGKKADILRGIEDKLNAKFGMDRMVPLVKLEAVQNRSPTTAQTRRVEAAITAHKNAVEAMRKAGLNQLANDTEKAFKKAQKEQKAFNEVQDANTWNPNTAETRGLVLAIRGGEKKIRDTGEVVKIESDALEISLVDRLGEGRQTKQLPMASNNRKHSTIETGFGYTGEVVKMGRYRKPLNLPLFDATTGRFISNRSGVRLARCELKTGNLQTVPVDQWLCRVQMNKRKSGFIYPITQVAVEMPDTGEYLLVWACVVRGEVA